MTYLEALSELQQRGFDALKVAQATQLSALKTTRDCAAALAESSPPTVSVPAAVTDLTSALAAFGFALLEQQVDYARRLTNTLTPAFEPVRTPDFEVPFGSTTTESTPLASTPEPALVSAPPEPVAPLFGQADSAATAAVEVLGAPVTIDNADAPPMDERKAVAAETRLDAAILAADHDEALSKVLPAPVSPLAPGPRLPENKSAAKRSKIASVSGDVPSAKRRSTTK